jgi:hypothetical protein
MNTDAKGHRELLVILREWHVGQRRYWKRQYAMDMIDKVLEKEEGAEMQRGVSADDENFARQNVLCF